MKEIGRNPIEQIGHKKIRAGGDENQGFFLLWPYISYGHPYAIFRIYSCQ